VNQPMTFQIEGFKNASGQLNQQGSDAGSQVSGGVSSNLSPPAASSPVGNGISMLTGQLQTGLSPAGPALTQGADGLNGTTQSAMAGIGSQDEQNAQGFGQSGLGGADGLPGSGDLNPDSIDKEAKHKAQDMLGGDQMQQIMQQLLSTGVQAGSQVAQQLGQQLSQLSSQLGQVVGQAGQQVGQLASKAAESAAKSAVDASQLADTGLGDLGSGLGGAGGGGGLGDAGATIPAGLEEPVTPMNGSSALMPSALPPAGAPASAASAASRMPMMPMMPMHAAQRDKDGATTKRDPVIFPESKIYEPPQGVEQTFGAIPEIESEEPPFGTASD
jgi:hypothetical protein